MIVKGGFLRGGRLFLCLLSADRNPVIRAQKRAIPRKSYKFRLDSCKSRLDLCKFRLDLCKFRLDLCKSSLDLQFCLVIGQLFPLLRPFFEWENGNISGLPVSPGRGIGAAFCRAAKWREMFGVKGRRISSAKGTPVVVKCSWGRRLAGQ